MFTVVNEVKLYDRVVFWTVSRAGKSTPVMLFTDGNRIDLQIETKEFMLESYVSDKLTIPLLDKDNCLPIIAAPTDIDYHVKEPTEALFMSCCNDFWWCSQNVAKGIWRDELPYVKQMFEHVIRPRLDEMISWWVGTKNEFQVSIGKMGKYMKKYLPESYWKMYKETYSDSNPPKIRLLLEELLVRRDADAGHTGNCLRPGRNFAWQ